MEQEINRKNDSISLWQSFNLKSLFIPGMIYKLINITLQITGQAIQLEFVPILNISKSSMRNQLAKSVISREQKWLKEYNQLLGNNLYSKKPGYMPFKAKSLNPSKRTMFYTPQPDKLEGYGQFPSAVTQPYYNQKRELTLNPLKRKEIKEQAKFFLPDSMKNEKLFKYSGVHSFNIGTSYLTDSVYNYQKCLQDGNMKVMEERKLTEFRPKLDMNSTKMLNGKTLEPPHSEIVDKLLRKSLVKSEKNLLKKTLTQNRYKGQPDFGVKLDYTQTLEENKSQLIEQYVSQQEMKDVDFEHFKQMSSIISSQTFDQESFCNPSKLKPQSQKLKGNEHFNQDLLQQKQQLEAFILPPTDVKKKLNTKGRFKTRITSTKIQYEKDREIMMLIFPEIFEEKEDPKKQLQEELRRKINRMKEEEMLERNLRNKI